MTLLGGVSGVATFALGSSLFAIAAAHDDNGVQLLSLGECVASSMQPTAENVENISTSSQNYSDTASFSGSFSGSDNFRAGSSGSFSGSGVF